MSPPNTLPPSPPPAAQLQGTVERVTFHNEENGFSVLRVKAQGHRDLVTVLGHVSSVSAGEFVEAGGQWVQHREFGLQLKADWIKTVHPSTLEGIEKYLGSGLIKGIGPHFAKKLVDAFGFEVFDIIEKSPSRLTEVNGIGLGRRDKIVHAWQDQRNIREIMVFLQSHGVGTAKAVRIYKTYGQDAIARVQANPYQLARDIHGIGFKSADLIASHLGVAKDSLVRARAGVHYTLLERLSDGHCAFPENDLLNEAVSLLEIPEDILRQALTQELDEHLLIRDDINGTPCIYLPGLHFAERDTARLLRQLSQGSPPWGAVPPEKAEQAAAWAGQRLGFPLAPAQVEAVKTALSSKVMVITGGPGTGKTTLTRAIVTLVKAKGLSVALCSPTGRAARRLSECTGLEAKTIHRLLKWDRGKGGFLHDRQNPLAADLVLLDEASMVDMLLMHALVKAIRPAAAFVIIGDVDQIPSVGPGEVLAGILESDAFPAVRLTEIFRQAAQSRIVVNAHRINQGLMPESAPDKASDFHFIPVEDPLAGLARIVDLVKDRIPKAFGLHPVRDIQVLSPMNRGALGTRTLNAELQKALNPNPSAKVERFGYAFCPGDKVMVTVNDYDKDVFNGDIGTVKSVDPVEQELVVDFDGRDVVFEFGELDILSLAYATSIHKSQGSEYPAVVIPLFIQHYVMLKRNLLYTGVTRGKRLVVLIGQKKSLAVAVKTHDRGRRWTFLAGRLRAETPADPSDDPPGPLFSGTIPPRAR
jgi:exodeoxyribonuclease V alpha subunit